VEATLSAGAGRRPAGQAKPAPAPADLGRAITLMGTGSALYRIVLLVHILASIVGFGGVIANGLYHARAFRGPARVAGELLGATRGVTRIADYAIYAVLPLGIVLIAVSDDAFSFGDPWVSASFVVWFLLVGAAHAAVRPAVRALSTRAGALGPDTVLDTDPEAGAAARKLMVGEAATQLLLVVALVLMIWKPGS
jgi:uncharacterized membrane protein